MEKRIEKITRHAEVSEKAIEQYLVRKVKELGGVCLKYSNAGMVGYPDRVCLLPGRWAFWVELKSKGGRLSEVQKARQWQIRRLGHPVYVCRSRADVDGVLELYREEELRFLGRMNTRRRR